MTQNFIFTVKVFYVLSDITAADVWFLCVLSATDEAWRLLESYLLRYPSCNGQHHHCIINKLLSHGVPLPDWLVKSYKVRD